MLLRVEQPAPAVNVDASVWCFPFAINETYNNLWFALVTSELDGFDEDLDWWNAKNGASDTYVLIDQMTLYHAHREDLVEIVKTKYNHTLVIEAVDVEAHVV